MTLQWGILGTGRHADVVVAPAINLARQSSVGMVVSRDLGRARSFAARHQSPKLGTQYVDMLGDSQIDVIHVATPNVQHEGAVLAALEAGKHVFCDKPLALSSGGASRIGNLASRRNLKVGVCFQLRHHPAHTMARELVQSGAVGETVFVEARAGSYGVASGWRTHRDLAGGGVTFDLGVHLYDLVRYVTGLEASAVCAMDDRANAEWLDRTSSTMLKMQNGTLAFTYCDHQTPYPSRSFEVHGSSGSVLCSHTTDLSWGGGASALRQITEAEVRDQSFAVNDLVLRIVTNFNNAVLRDEDPNPSWRDGLRSAEIVEAVRDSTACAAITSVKINESRSEETVG